MGTINHLKIRFQLNFRVHVRRFVPSAKVNIAVESECMLCINIALLEGSIKKTGFGIHSSDERIRVG
jgi:hypothetical protein